MMWSIFKIFFALGWVSFGGPAAHIGYFRQAFVEKREWLSDSEYAQLVALSQFLPGPGSSQVGFALGYKKGGVGGAFAAFLGFTLPSVLLMVVLASTASQLTDTETYKNIVHGLKLLAVVVVADATWGMYKNFCKNKLTSALAVGTAISLLLFPGIASQVIVLLLAGAIGSIWMKGEETRSTELFAPSYPPLILFLLLLVALPLVAGQLPFIDIFNSFYQAGSLVFGGGHVVVPLLQGLVGDQISQDSFLAGYAAAQAVPGPMFTLATYLGYEISSMPILGALVATLAVFLPGFLLLLAVLKNWQVLANKPRVSGVVLGANAAVVGLLFSALYMPIFTSSVAQPMDLALILAGLYLLKQLKLPIILLIGFFVVTAFI
jgi:chromate transporter